MANSLADWLRRYWVWLVLGGATLLGVLIWLAPTGNKGALKALKEAEEGVKKLKKQKAEELEAIDKKLESNIQELVEIKKIPDEQERLKRLAEFANRGG